MKCLARIALLAWVGAVSILASGCGGAGSAPVDPAGGEQRKQARIKAYGPSGNPPGKGEVINAQAAARQNAGQGGR